MLNQYGERRLVAVRVALSEITENVITGTNLPAGTVTGGVPASASFVDMQLYGTATEPVAGVILVYEDESLPVCVAGIVIPEVSAAVEVTEQTTRVVEEAAREPEAPAEPAE
jgi:hypothetical protein